MGDRVVAETGARRDSRDGKGRMDLISPIFVRELALCMEEGAKDPPDGYGERNWEKGMPLSWFYDSGLRHLFQWKETGDPKHLRAAAFNLMGLIHTVWKIGDRQLPVALYDVPHDDGWDERLIRLDKWLKEENETDEQEQREGTEGCDEGGLEGYADGRPEDYWWCHECAHSVHKSYGKCVTCGTVQPLPVEAERRDSIH